MQNTKSNKQNYSETLFLHKLFNVEVFGKNAPVGKYDTNFRIQTKWFEKYLYYKIIRT